MLVEYSPNCGDGYHDVALPLKESVVSGITELQVIRL